jgi:hypothetical protein
MWLLCNTLGPRASAFRWISLYRSELVGRFSWMLRARTGDASERANAGVRVVRATAHYAVKGQRKSLDALDRDRSARRDGAERLAVAINGRPKPCVCARRCPATTTNPPQPGARTGCALELDGHAVKAMRLRAPVVPSHASVARSRPARCRAKSAPFAALNRVVRASPRLRAPGRGPAHQRPRRTHQPSKQRQRDALTRDAARTVVPRQPT